MLKAAGLSAAQTLLLALVCAAAVVCAMEALGDPVANLLPSDAPPEQVAALRQKLGLDRPFSERLAERISHAAVGDFGASYAMDDPAGALVWRRLPKTLRLVGLGAIGGVVGGVVLGVLVYAARGRSIGRLALAGLLTLQALPSFVVAILAIRLVAVELRLLPPSGSDEPSSVILPALVLSLDLALRLGLFLDAKLVDVEAMPFVTVARGKGLRTWRVRLGHLMPVVLPGFLSFVALRLGALAGGALVVEEIFAYEGLGRLALFALRHRDLPLVLACVVTVVLLVGLVRMAADVARPIVDPRARYAA